jgi:ribosomal protein L37AE/L43A
MAASASDVWRCDACSAPVSPEYAYAPMESLEVLCRNCIDAKLKPCEECGARIRASAYQHLPTRRVLMRVVRDQEHFG